jgi:hypothetical protein
MPARKRTIKDFEAEAKWVGECLVHPSPLAPRKVYKLRHGQLLTEQYVCHKCDTVGCLVDDHHFVGSAKDNIRDSVKKGRHSSLRKGGTRFSGRHTDEAKVKISAASKRMWETRRETA